MIFNSFNTGVLFLYLGCPGCNSYIHCLQDNKKQLENRGLGWASWSRGPRQRHQWQEEGSRQCWQTFLETHIPSYEDRLPKLQISRSTIHLHANNFANTAYSNEYLASWCEWQGRQSYCKQELLRVHIKDLQLVLVRRALFHYQFRHWLYPEKVSPAVQIETHALLPSRVPEEHELLQDMQLGQPHCQSWSALDLGRREVVLLPLHPLHQPGQTNSWHDSFL